MWISSLLVLVFISFLLFLHYTLSTLTNNILIFKTTTELNRTPHTQKNKNREHAKASTCVHGAVFRTSEDTVDWAGRSDKTKGIQTNWRSNVGGCRCTAETTK